MVRLSESDIRECGLSAAKTKTIKGLADAAITGFIDFDSIQDLDDELIYSKLSSLWGIGPWTVDMFMMFQLGKLDVWPVGDLGVRRGWEKMYSLVEQISPSDFATAGGKFRPYRSVVAWYCWRAYESS